jgi:hypothetical protein
VKKYHIDVYDVWLHVAINYPKSKFFKTYFADRDCTETLESNVDHFQSKGFTWGILSTKKDPRVIFINLDLTRAEGILDLVDTMNHEAFHAATGILRWADVPMNDSTEEAYAYLVGFISKYIYKTVFDPKYE